MIQSDLEKQFSEGPDLVSKALLQWRQATLNREKIEATLYLFYKGQDAERTATELKALVNQDQKRYEAVLQEISFESEYTLRLESLLAAKKEASIRTAY